MLRSGSSRMAAVLGFLAASISYAKDASDHELVGLLLAQYERSDLMVNLSLIGISLGVGIFFYFLFRLVFWIFGWKFDSLSG